MFARLSPALADVGAEPGNGDLALAWIDLQHSQGVVARRQRLNCLPFSASSLSAHASSTSSSTTCNSSKAQALQHTQHRLLAVCCAGKHTPSSSVCGRTLPRRRGPRHQAVIKVGRCMLQQQPAAIAASGQQLRQQARAGVDPRQLHACIQAAASFSQLQTVCNTFLGHEAFRPQHAALVLSRLHLVRSSSSSSSSATDGQLLLVELLAPVLEAGCCLHPTPSPPTSCVAVQPQHQQLVLEHNWLSCGEVAAVCWSISRAGYQPTSQLLQKLLQQFWVDFGRQQQQQHLVAQPTGSSCDPITSSSPSGTGPLQQQQQWPPVAADEALSTLVAGLAGLGCRDGVCWARVRAAVQVALSDSVLPLHSLQQLVWGFAWVQAADTATVDALAAALHGRLPELETPEDLVQVVWSLHCMDCADTRLFDVAAQLMLQRVTHATAHSSSSSSRRAATLESPPHHHNLATTTQSGGRVPQQLSCTQQQQQDLSRRHGCSSSNPVQHHQPGKLLQAAAQQPLQQVLPAGASQAAVVCGSDAFSTLQQLDPLLCMLALYRDYCQPALSN